MGSEFAVPEATIASIQAAYRARELSVVELVRAYLGRIAFGKDLVTDKLERLGCVVIQPSNSRDGKLAVRTGTGRRLEVFVSTQRVGGYVFWTKRRLHPSEDRLAVVVLLGDEPEPAVYLVPSLDWTNASPPLTDRDYAGGKSEPEYGIEIGPSALTSLRRYAWTDTSAERYFS